VKAKHRDPTGLLHTLEIPEKKWELVTIDFITKFPRTTRKHDSIIIVVDKLKNDAHFVPMKMTHTTTNIAEIYMREIVLDKDTKFTSNIWRGLFKGFGTNLNFSISYHPWSYGKI
jgi:hypothetical protein